MNVITVVGEGVLYLFTQGIQLKVQPKQMTNWMGAACHRQQFIRPHTVILHHLNEGHTVKFHRLCLTYINYKPSAVVCECKHSKRFFLWQTVSVHEYTIQCSTQVLIVEIYVMGKTSESILANLEGHFPGFQLFQNQQDILFKIFWTTGSLLINSKCNMFIHPGFPIKTVGKPNVPSLCY
jgi:hypothetical protein